MSKVIILGSSNAIPDLEHENTHMVVVSGQRMVMIDCAGNPILRLRQAGLDFHALTDLVLTHFHPDHVSGVPLLLMNMWLMGRRRPLNIYGLHYTLDRVEGLMGFYNWSEWPDFFPAAFYRLPAAEMTTVMDETDLRIFASPVRHLLPTIGLRIEFPATQKVVAYSCDTEPCAEVVRLAQGADVLLHEASGAQSGHSSAAQAGDIARRAEVARLYLIHYPTGVYQTNDLIAEARQRYPGPVELARDFMVIEV